MSTATEPKVGKVTQVIGSTFDAEFPEDGLPAIYNAVKIQSDQKGIKLDLTGEVQQQADAATVRPRLEYAIGEMFRLLPKN